MLVGEVVWRKGCSEENLPRGEAAERKGCPRRLPDGGCPGKLRLEFAKFHCAHLVTSEKGSNVIAN